MSKISQYPDGTPTTGDKFIFSRSGKNYKADADDLGIIKSGPQGFGDNYVITPSVSSNILSVALKTLAGATPSASDKISFRIGDAKRDITSALILVEAPANSFNAGSTELAGQKVQLFVYIGWKTATSEAFLGVSRIPDGRTYADFSTTWTNEKYLKVSLAVGPAATDPVECIGRIDVQNSGSASYNWSLPAGAVVVNRPIYETGILTWTPQGSAAGTGSPTWSITSVGLAEYIRRGSIVHIEIFTTGTTGGSTVYELRSTLPFEVKNSGSTLPAVGTIFDTGLQAPAFGLLQAGTPDFVGCRKQDSSNFGIGAGRWMKTLMDYIAE